jgi:putative ABC transport system permease protein
VHDLKFAFRQLLKNPGFTFVAVLTLALGIGATTAITSVVWTALFDPLPVPHADRFVTLFAKHRQQGWTAPGLDAYAAREVEANTNLFRRVALWNMDSLTLEGGTFPQHLGGLKVTRDFFTMFGVAPLLGRLPAEEEALPGAAPVMLLSHGIWQRVFGGDPAIVGRAVRFKQATITVIGVMPPHFALPNGNYGYWQAWSGPAVQAGDMPDTSSGIRSDMLANTGVIAELQPGANAAQTQAFLEVVRGRHAALLELHRELAYPARDFRESFSRPELRRTLWALWAATALVLLIAAANLANLQLARTETRRQELAVRAALGAGRAQIIRQLLGESLLLAGLGGVAGLLVTWPGLDLLTRLLPAELPRLKATEINGGVLALSSLVTLATGVLFGVMPAWRGGQSDVGTTLKLGAATATGSPDRAWFTRGLIVGQVALVLVLLSGAGLMVRSVSKLLAVDVGFDARRVVRLYPPVDFDAVNQFLGSEEGMRRAEAHFDAIYEDLQRRLSALPGVEAVGIVQPGGQGIRAATAPTGPPQVVGEQRIGLETADPLRAMRARLKQGTWLARGDGEKGRERVLVNETAARRLWPGARAVGQRLWLNTTNQEASVEVAGVIGDLRENAYNQDPAPTIYRAAPMALFGPGRALVVRTSIHYAALREAVERELKAAGAGHAQPQLAFMEEELYWGTAGHRTLMRYLLFFAGAGLALAAIGLYGVFAYRVSRRTRELGIRIAVGAQRSDIIRLVLRQGLGLVTAGTGLGLAVALAATRSLRAFLFGIPAHDPITFAAGLLLMVAVALFACWLPARRAARVDPMTALRTE